MKRLVLTLVTVMLSFWAYAQGDNVTGKVTEENGDPVIGAVVYYEGTNTSSITNARGEYSIKAIPGKDLTYSYIGMKTAYVTVGKQRKVDVTLKVDATVLDDAVVIGYGVQQRSDLTGSIATVKADELRKAGQDDVLGSLQGHVAGLNITSQSGEPGSGYSIQIRGNNSINAATTPLVVIDGMPMDINNEEGASSSMSASNTDPLAFLNPVDIASIEVLKDASATAIYGSRGANGVILITTKSGASDNGKTSVTFDAKVGVTTIARDIEMLDAQEWINYRFERHTDHYEYFGKDTDDDGVVDAPKTVEEYGKEPVNWRDVMFRNALQQNYNLSVRTKVGKGTNILASIGYLNQQGLIVNNQYQKFTAKVKVDHQVNKKVYMGVNVNYARMQNDGAASSSGGGFANNGLTQMIYLEKPIDIKVPGSDDEYELTSSTSLYDIVTKETTRRGLSHRLTGNAYVSYYIIPELNWRTTASANLSFADNKEFYSPRSRWGYSKNGVATVGKTSSEGYTVNTTLTYKKSWQKAHNFDAMVGGELNNYIFDGYSQQANNFEDYSLGYYGLAKGDILLPTQTHNDNGRLSAFARVNYNYKSRYYLTANFRADASSRFSTENRMGYFPSASFAWRISNEKFLRRAKQLFLDNLKLRLSAGTSGNDRISNYANLSTLDKMFYSDATGQQIMGMAEYSAGNPKLKWETTYQYDAGIDITMFNGRIDFTFDAYYKDTRDMLFKATLPSQSGFSQQWANIGQVSNKGLEFSLSTINVQKRDFRWSTNLTFDMNRNKILNLGDGIDMMANNISKGLFKDEPTRLMLNQPIGVIWGYQFDGNYQLSDFDIYYRYTQTPVDPSWVNPENYSEFDYVLKDGVTQLNGTKVKPGDRKYKDLNGDGVVKEDDDKTIIGNSYPEFSYGIGNTFSWRGLDLYIFFDGIYGRDLLNEFKCRSTPGEGNSTYMYNVTKESYYGAWRPGNGSNYHARLVNSQNCQQPVSSYYVEDGSFFRLKTISLSYNLPSKAVKAIKFQGLKFTFNVDNVWMWTHYGGLDPDISTTNSTFPGLDRLTYPKGRTYSLGLVATF